MVGFVLSPGKFAGVPSVRRRTAVCKMEPISTNTGRKWIIKSLAALVATGLPQKAVASTGQRIAESLRAKGIPDLLVLSVISAMPIVELRGGVPVGYWMGLDPVRIFTCCVLGNLIPVLPLLLALKSPAVRRIMNSAIERATNLAKAFGDDRKRLIALSLFVGIPFPGTGAWTGTMVAYVLNMPVVPAFLSIASGVALSGLIMSALCMMGIWGAVVAIAVMLAAGLSTMFSGRNRIGPDVEEEETATNQ